MNWHDVMIIHFGPKAPNFIHPLPKYQNMAGLSLRICRNKGNNLWSFLIFNRLNSKDYLARKFVYTALGLFSSKAQETHVLTKWLPEITGAYVTEITSKIFSCIPGLSILLVKWKKVTGWLKKIKNPAKIGHVLPRFYTRCWNQQWVNCEFYDLVLKPTVWL